ncbi:hypothetical protein [Streptomyces noursei]
MLTTEEHALLATLAEYQAPAALSHLMDTYINPGGPDDWEGRSGHEEWTRRQLALSAAAIDLQDNGLVKTVYPSNGYRPDLVLLTEAGQRALDEANADDGARGRLEAICAQ